MTSEKRLAQKREANRNYAERHPDRVLEQARESYQRNKAARREHARAARVTNPWYRSRMARAVNFANNSNRRAALYGPCHKITGREVVAVQGPCHYCGGEPNGWDHVVALVNGGSNTADNLVPCCWPCNTRKSKLPAEFASLPMVMDVPCATCGTIMQRPREQVLRSWRLQRGQYCPLHRYDTRRKAA